MRYIAEIIARSDAAFDGRTFDAMSRHDRERYVERALAAISSLTENGYTLSESPEAAQRRIGKGFMDFMLPSLRSRPY